MIKISELIDVDGNLILEKILNNIVNGNVYEVLKLIPDNSIDMCVTSPPYYGLRDYGTTPVILGGNSDCEHEWVSGIKKGITGGKNSDKVKIKGKENYQIVNDREFFICEKCQAYKGELGSEPNKEMFIDHLNLIFDELYRVLKDDGSFYLNIADTYNKNRSMMGIPERIMLKMLDSKWVLKNKIIWEKNPVPESMKNRFTRTYEHLFFFTKKQDYYFEQQLEDSVTMDNKRNMRDIWKISIQPFIATKYGDFDVDHFASFPRKLVSIPILASCPNSICENCGNPRLKYYEKIGESSYSNMKGVDTSSYKSEQGIKQSLRADRECFERDYIEKYKECGCKTPKYSKSGIVLDIFMGTGTTAVESLSQNKNFIGIELNPKFAEIAEARIESFKKSEEYNLIKSKKSISKFI